MFIFCFADVCEPDQDRLRILEMSTVDCSGDEPLTKQSFRDEVDINRIMARYEKTGHLPDEYLSRAEPFYGECTPIDLMNAIHTVQAADDLFMAIPAEARAKFNNDPVMFLAAVEDPAQHDFLRSQGLMKPKPSVDVPASPLVPPGTPPVPPGTP